MSIPTPACTPAARPDPVPRAASPAGAGLWIAPAVWKTRTIRSRLNAPASRRVSHTALDGTERRPHAPQARSLYSSNTTSRVGLVHPLRIRWEKTDRPTSLRSDERSRSPESVFTIPGFGVQLHRNAQFSQEIDDLTRSQPSTSANALAPKSCRSMATRPTSMLG